MAAGGGGNQMEQLGQIMGDRLMQAAQVMEEQIDAEMHKMDNFDEDDFEQLRKQRMEALKKAQQQKQEWLKQGHGEYSEIPEEKEFFNVTKNSENVVVHFYLDDKFRCKILDKHLQILAPKHPETKFCKINAEKCPFLTNRLKIKVIPTMAVIKGGKTRDYIVGFTDLGNTDEFTTEMLEWRLGCTDIIKYSGDLMAPPGSSSGDKKKTSILAKPKAKIIRGSGRKDESSDEDDW